MGFVVLSNGHVQVDHTIDGFCSTRIYGNPTHAKTRCGMSVYSVFMRKSHNTSKKRQVGDNCPMIYALKRREGLYTKYSDIKMILKTMPIIIDKFLIDREYDLIISMPSSHKISEILARRIHRKLSNSKFISDVFRKITIGEAILQINKIKLPQDKLASIMSDLKRQRKISNDSESLSLKDIKAENRVYLSPIVFTSDCKILEGQSRILLVDDLFATGTTLIGARKAISSVFTNAQVDALCLFSPLNGNIKHSRS